MTPHAYDVTTKVSFPDFILFSTPHPAPVCTSVTPTSLMLYLDISDSVSVNILPIATV